VADLVRVRVWANALIALHLDPSWTFDFDHARRRAGLCNYTHKRITVSRHLATLFEDDDIHQVLLHEVAHAIAGAGTGHGPKWKKVAAELGYEGGTTHDGPTADHLAPWIGACPSGHTYYRHREPKRPQSCGRCARGYSAQHVIAWQRRDAAASA
jgi:predicted SprT family Zn-dependent metalloprotease